MYAFVHCRVSLAVIVSVFVVLSCRLVIDGVAVLIELGQALALSGVC